MTRDDTHLIPKDHWGMSQHLHLGQLARPDMLTAAPDATVRDAARRMAENQCSSVVVMENGRPEGIFTERDALALDLVDPRVLDMPLREVMSGPVVSTPAATSLHEAGRTLHREGIRHLLVTDDDGTPTGIVTRTDLVRHQGAEAYLRVREVGSVASRTPLKVAPDTELAEAVGRMRAQGAELCIVEATAHAPAGIITERDIIRHLAEGDGSCAVDHVASRPLQQINNDDSLVKARELFTTHGIRHLAVADHGGRITHVLTFADLLSAVETGYMEHQERAFRDLSRRNNLILEAAGEGILGLDDAGLVTFVNRAAEQVTGWSRDGLVGRPCHDTLHHTRRDGTPFEPEGCPVLAALAEGTEKRVTSEVFWRADGSWFPVEYVVSPLREDGQVTGAVVVFEDITRRKQVEDSLKLEKVRADRAQHRLHDALEAMPDGFTLWDSDDRLVLANEKMRRLFAPVANYLRPGTSFREFLRAAINDGLFVDARDGDEVWMAARLADHQNPPTEPLECRLADGTWLRITESLTDDGGRAGVVSDITALKERESALRVAEQRQRTLNEELQRSNAELEQFAYAVSHDLQEPLRMIANFTGVLQRRYAGQLDGAADTYIRQTADAATRMKSMIDALLDYSRVTTRGKAPAPVNAGICLQTALENLRLSIDETEATVEAPETLPDVEADDGQLARLFQNLISNALKYRHPERRPVVAVWPDTPDDDNDAGDAGGMVRFNVADNGLGIRPEDREQIFQIFRRLQSPGASGGSGIGLAVCKRIVERHGGRIEVEGAQGEGSVFRFTLPAAG